MRYAALMLQSSPNPEAVRHLVMTMLAIIPAIIVAAIALLMVPCWFILKKAGLTPWLSMLCIIPSLGTLVLLYILAFTDWNVVPAPQPVWPPRPPYTPPPPPFPPQS
jgi:protein-S-isoprenylcysteine O-methyltransferase Ste14